MSQEQLGEEQRGTDYKKLSLYVALALLVVLLIFSALVFLKPVTALHTVIDNSYFSFGGGSFAGGGAGR